MAKITPDPEAAIQEGAQEAVQQGVGLNTHGVRRYRPPTGVAPKDLSGEEPKLKMRGSYKAIKPMDLIEVEK